MEPVGDFPSGEGSLALKLYGIGLETGEIVLGVVAVSHAWLWALSDIHHTHRGSASLLSFSIQNSKETGVRVLYHNHTTTQLCR